MFFGHEIDYCRNNTFNGRLPWGYYKVRCPFIPCFYPTAEALITYLVLNKHFRAFFLLNWIARLYGDGSPQNTLHTTLWNRHLTYELSPRFSSYHYLHPWLVAHCCWWWSEQSLQRFDDGSWPSPFLWKLEDILSSSIESFVVASTWFCSFSADATFWNIYLKQMVYVLLIWYDLLLL